MSRTTRGTPLPSARHRLTTLVRLTTLLRLTVALTLIAGMAALPAAPTTASEVVADRTGLQVYAEQLLLAAHNEIRRDPTTEALDVRAVGELVWSSELAALARASSDRMAGLGRLAHDPAVDDARCCERPFAHNIGVASNSTDGAAAVRSATNRMLAAWLDSAMHLGHLLDPRFTHAGVGVHVDDTGRVWATVVFEDRSALSGAIAPIAPGALEPVDITSICPQTPTHISELFRDVEGRHAHAIDCLAARGIINGVGDGRFDPAATVTRAQFAMLIARTLVELEEPLPPPIRGVFTDVAAGGTATDAIERAAGAGIMTGRPDGRFVPAAPVSRGQVAALLDGTLRFLEGDPVPTAGGSFPDVTSEHRFARAIDVVGRSGLLTGDADGRFHAERPVRRDHAAAVIARLLAAR